MTDISLQLEASIQASRESAIYRSGVRNGEWVVKANGVIYPQENYSEARRFLLEWRQTRAMEIYKAKANLP